MSKLTRWEREQAEKRASAKLLAEVGRCYASGCKRQAITGMHCAEHERAFWAKAAEKLGPQLGMPPAVAHTRGMEAADVYINGAVGVIQPAPFPDAWKLEETIPLDEVLDPDVMAKLRGDDTEPAQPVEVTNVDPRACTERRHAESGETWTEAMMRLHHEHVTMPMVDRMCRELCPELVQAHEHDQQPTKSGRLKT